MQKFPFGPLDLSEVFQKREKPSLLSRLYAGVTGFWPIVAMTALGLALTAIALGVGCAIAYVLLIAQAWAWNTIAPLFSASAPVIAWKHVLAWWLVVNVAFVMPARAIVNAVRAK